jgi:hypothetical protein
MLKALFISVMFLLHPVHVTLTSIDYVPENDSFKVFIKMYFDDFINDNRLAGIEIDARDFEPVGDSAMSSMQRYLKEKVIINVNGKILTGNISDMTLADNEISMNLNYGGNKAPQRLTVQNLIMIRLYSDMSNMILLRINSFEEGFRLTSDMTEKIFNIKY